MNILKKLFPIGKKHERNINLNRNDLCWCGSGKKYKKCHMEADEPLRSKTRPELTSAR